MFWDFFHWAPMHRKQKERVLSKQKQNKKELKKEKKVTNTMPLATCQPG